MKRISKLFFLLVLLIAISCTQKPDVQQQIAELFKKQDVKILITDSGFGGLSVAADLIERLPASGVFQSAEIVFFNSLFRNNSGYNSLKQEKRKVHIFNAALNAMAEKYKPDLLLIACNTLSVIYDKTPFSKKAPFPVVGIVETGVDLITGQFEQQPDADVIIFATKTTIGSQAHKKQLLKRGYNGDQIIGQPCHKLAGSIERGFDSQETTDLIQKFVADALEKRENSERPLFASFNCTHYGYVMQQFEDEFAANAISDIYIIDPNLQMSDFLFQPQYSGRFDSTATSISVVSKVTISDDKMKSLSALLARQSAATVSALQEYQHVSDLFKY